MRLCDYYLSNFENSFADFDAELGRWDGGESYTYTYVRVRGRECLRVRMHVCMRVKPSAPAPL